MPVVLASMLFACSGGGSGGSSDTSFRIQSGDIEKFESPVLGTETITTNSTAHDINYAIIYSGTINDTDYVGIAFSNNSAINPYSLKIYFTASSIPTGTAVVISNATIIEKINNVTTTNTTETVTLDITGPSTVTGGSNTYYTYSIDNGSSTSFINSITGITALHVGPDATKK